MKTFKQLIEAKDKDVEGDGDAYKKFFAQALKKFGVDSPEDLKGDQRKKFYDYIDANWKADDEKKESKNVKEDSCSCEEHDIHENCDENCKCSGDSKDEVKKGESVNEAASLDIPMVKNTVMRNYNALTKMEKELMGVVKSKHSSGTTKKFVKLAVAHLKKAVKELKNGGFY